MNFTRVERGCYHFSDRTYNWKSASSMCKSLGSNLLELETPDEYSELITYLSSVSSLRGMLFIYIVKYLETFMYCTFNTQHHHY